MKTILIPTDFSKDAKNALDYAIQMSKNEKVKIILLHAFHDSYILMDTPVPFVVDQIMTMEKDANKKLNLLRLKVEKENKIKCEIISKHGFVIDVVLDIIKNNKVDLVVMGTKGASGAKEILMGSNTAKVIEKASCPVIAVPEGARFSSFKKITYATDYHSSDIICLKQLVNMAKPYKAQINILHVADGEYNEETESQLMKEFMETGNKQIDYYNVSFQLLFGKNIQKALEKYLKERYTDLLVMSTRNRNLLDKLFNKSITKKIALHTTIPLMVFHYKQDSTILI